ncbi:response regulator [Bradyrhizobium sp. LA7.1]|uniref:response regulator n=1 Tax=Bradyrhizobium sp. LA7.1 TaxID=3156324 RepID=UPI0033934C46
MRVLLVEDEARLVDLLRATLVDAGFVVDAMTSAGDARAALAVGVYDVVILDLGLPDGDGLDVLASARRGGKNMPILVLTARDAVEDRVRGLDAGADDYLVKPFATTELVARTKALLRRPGHALGTTLKAGNILFDTIGRDVRIHGDTLTLARQELSVLEHLMRRLGRVVPKAVLEEKLYGIDDELGSNAIPVHVHHLRRKLTESGATCAIHTVRGIGYLLTEEPS